MRIQSSTLNKLGTYIALNFGTIDKKYYFLTREVFSMGDNLIGLTYRYLKSSFNLQDELGINIKFKNYQKINAIRNDAIKKGILVRSKDDKVSGFLSYRGVVYPVRIRLKGDWTDHLLGEKWSFRIETKNQKSFLGMKEFSLQHPRTRNYINEYVFHQFLKYEKLPYLRYKYIPVSINGKYLGIYALEEHFTKLLLENSGFREGPIIKISDQEKRGEFQRMRSIDKADNFFVDSPITSDIKTFNYGKVAKDKNKISQFRLGSDLLNEFINKKISTADTFNLELTAKYFALSDLIQSVGSNTWYDMRFYFDPISNRFIPIGYDASPSLVINQRLLSIDQNVLNIFDDPQFVRKYVEALEKITEKEYLDDFLKEISKELKNELSILNKSFPFVRFFEKDLIKNQKYIQKRLEPLNPISAKLAVKYENSDNTIELEVRNKNKFPIEIIGVEKDGTKFKTVNNKYIPGTKIFKKIRDFNIQFEIDKNSSKQLSQNNIINSQSNIQDQTSLVTINLIYKIAGSNNIKTKKINLLPWVESTKVQDQFVKRAQTLGRFPSLSINNKSKVVTINNDINIEEKLILPINYELIIKPGVNIVLSKEGLIIVQGPLVIQGEAKKPISIESKNDGKGILVLNSNNKSYVKNVKFKGLRANYSVSSNITGGLSFYNSDVEIANAEFIDARSEDALNLVNSGFSIKNSSFENTLSDAIDADFSDGKIENTSFRGIGNDAIDISGGEVYANSVQIFSAGDKGISVGERSRLYSNDISISNTFIGIASKDYSYAEVNRLNIANVKNCLAAYQKKSEYGPGMIKLNNDNSACFENYILESGSSISSPRDLYLPNTDQAFEMLYSEEKLINF
ncbi:CotH kinase family protein [Prochlorococcus sp. AH-716-O10]|nr:CotH kinase family protein [Prochlorococcus sp. AH-716-O10]